MQKRNLRRAIFAGVFTALAAASAAVYADHKHKSGHHHGPEAHGQYLAEKFARGIDLDDAQKAQVAEIFADYFAQRKARRDETRDQFAELWRRPQLHSTDIEAAMDEAKRRREDARALTAEGLAALHGVLTPQQRERAIERFGRLGAKALAEGKFGGHRRGWGKGRHHGGDDHHRGWRNWFKRHHDGHHDGDGNHGGRYHDDD